LPERPIQLLVGALFIIGGVMTWRAGKDDDEESTAKWSTTMSNSRVAWTAASVILVAEFGDLTQLATAGFAARFDDPVAVAVGAVLALSSVSGLAVLTGSWLTTKVPLRVIQRSAALLFFVIGVTTLVTALA
jgi:putative Ca2+/H+ antiporter (TMEM165/GDT1 family)